eukprot:2461400-Rhodomonas_salina.2
MACGAVCPRADARYNCTVLAYGGIRCPHRCQLRSYATLGTELWCYAMASTDRACSGMRCLVLK